MASKTPVPDFNDGYHRARFIDMKDALDKIRGQRDELQMQVAMLKDVLARGGCQCRAPKPVGPPRAIEPPSGQVFSAGVSV